MFKWLDKTQMGPTVQRGRRIVLGHSLAVLLVPGMFAAIRLWEGASNFPEALGPFGTTLSLCVVLYLGSRGARWIAVVLFGGWGLLMLLFGQQLLAVGPPLRFVVVWHAMMVVPFLSFAAVLIVSPNVKAFLEHQRTRYRLP